MKARRSPFRPSFGVTPPTLAGRDRARTLIGDALDEGAGSPARISLVTGARGMGKTVLLNAAEDEARERGWLVISETLTPGLVARIETEHVPAAWRSLTGTTVPDPRRGPTRRQVSGISVPAGLGGLSFSVTPVEPLVGLRANLSALTDTLAERGSGLLITLDEVHRASGRLGAELQVLAATIQHLWREDRAVGFLGAGLPAAVDDVLGDEVLTFLRRAQRVTLGLLSDDDVADALSRPVVAAGRRLAADALAAAVELCAGYPFLVQIVGDLAWRADPVAATITRAHVEAVADRAIRELGEQVHAPALAQLSERDLDLLHAMLPDEGASRVADVYARLGVDNAYGSRYRRRLLVAGLVRADGRGRLAFALPHLREHLETQLI